MFTGLKIAAKRAVPPRGLIHVRAWAAWLSGEPEIRLLPLLCDRGRVALDIGANVGVYSYFLRKYSTLCHAFEPHPQLADYLRRSFSSGVAVHDMALSDRDGDATLSVPLYQNRGRASLPIDGRSFARATIDPDNRLGGVATEDIKVRCRRLDHMGIEGIGFMKIDVEGHEFSVLKGATGILRRNAPTLLIECVGQSKTGGVQPLNEFLKGFGYQGFFLVDGRLKPLAEFDPDRHQNPKDLKSNKKPARAGYVYNFLFAKHADVLQRLEKLRA